MVVVVYINVGGQTFSTTSATLGKFPGSKLAAIAGEAIKHGGEGVFFFDRDPRTFPEILNYFRTGVIPTPDTLQHRIELLNEARFFELAELTAALSSSGDSPNQMSLANQQKLVKAEFASTVKSQSVARFLERCPGYDVLFTTALTLISQHAASQDGPWLVLNLANMLAMAFPGPQDMDLIQVDGISLVRFLCDGLRTLGFCVLPCFNPPSLQIDLWSPGCDAPPVPWPKMSDFEISEPDLSPLMMDTANTAISTLSSTLHNHHHHNNNHSLSIPSDSLLSPILLPHQQHQHQHQHQQHHDLSNNNNSNNNTMPSTSSSVAQSLELLCAEDLVAFTPKHETSWQMQRSQHVSLFKG